MLSLRALRGLLFFVSAIAVGVAAGAFLFRATNPVVWQDTLAKVEASPWGWSAARGPAADAAVQGVLDLKAASALAAPGTYTAALDPALARMQRPDLAPELALAGLTLRPAPALAAGRPARGSELMPLDRLPATAAGSASGAIAHRTALATNRVEPVVMRPAEARGQPTRVDRELARLGPDDLALNFFPGSRLQPGQSLKSFDARSTTTSVTLSASAPLSEVAAFYRSQFHSTAADRSRVTELRPAPGELAFSDSSGTVGDRRAYLFQAGDTVLITLVRTQPGIVR